MSIRLTTVRHLPSPPWHGAQRAKRSTLWRRLKAERKPCHCPSIRKGMVQTSHKACIPRTFATRWWMGKMVTELEWQQKQQAKRAERQVKRKGFGRTSQPFPPTILLLPPCHPVRPKPMATPERASDSANQHCRRLCTRTSSRCRTSSRTYYKRF